MRRAKLKVDRQEDLITLLGEIEWGVLGMTGPDGWPQVKPVNFVYLNGRLYFHGAKEGEKIDAMAADDRVTFVAIKDFSVIPSHFTHETMACPATQFYQTVMIRGRTRIVDDRADASASARRDSRRRRSVRDAASAAARSRARDAVASRRRDSASATTLAAAPGGRTAPIS